MNMRLLAVLIGIFTFTAIAEPAQAVLHSRMGRFMQRDPIGTQSSITVLTAIKTNTRQLPFVAYVHSNHPQIQYHDGLNLHQYVKSNPIHYLDPSGLKCKSKPIGGTVMRRLPGSLGHEWIDIGGDRRGFYPQVTEKPGLFEKVPGVWLDEKNNLIRLPDGSAIPRDEYFVQQGMYHEWEVKNKCSGKFKYGPNDGKKCKCASLEEIKSCINAYTAPGNIAKYCAFGGNCRDRAADALSACCAKRGKKTHSAKSSGQGTTGSGST